MNDQFIFEVNKAKKEGPVKAYGDMTVLSDQGEFTISGFKVIQKNDDDLFVVMPDVSFKNEKGEWDNKPKIDETSRSFKNYAKESILSKYSSMK